jgi:hypothetical protein
VNTNVQITAYRRFGLGFALALVVTTNLGVSGVADGSPSSSAAPRCRITEGSGSYDYKPNAPLRSRVGSGFVLSGTIRSGIDCAVLPRARVEIWLAGPNGYDDAHRGAVITDSSGRFHFESNFPPSNHIHVRVAVPGFRPLSTVYFPRAGTTTGTVELVLEPDV